MAEQITAVLTVDSESGKVQISSFVSETEKQFSQMEETGSSSWENMMDKIVTSIQKGDMALSDLAKSSAASAVKKPWAGP